jgi:hypothetical protein
LGVSRQGEFKNTTNIFLQKVHVGKKIRNFDKNFDVSFSSTFFVLSRFRVVSSDGSSKTLQKTFYKKNRVEKLLTKNSTQKIQNRLFLGFIFITFWGATRCGELKNTTKNIGEKKSDPSPFSYSDSPRGPFFFGAGPLLLKPAECGNRSFFELRDALG